MSQVYREKILRDIDDIPLDMLPKFYKVVHLLKTELIGEREETSKKTLAQRNMERL